MSIDGRIRESMKTYLLGLGLDAYTVTGWYEEYQAGGTCGEGTCWYDDEFTVDMYYTNSRGIDLTHTYTGKFGDLIKELSDGE